jgi:hypothetical protein
MFDEFSQEFSHQEIDQLISRELDEKTTLRFSQTGFDLFPRCDPHDIIWENLEPKSGFKVIKSLLLSFLALAMFLFLTTPAVSTSVDF